MRSASAISTRAGAHQRYRQCAEEYTLLNRVAAAWESNDRERFEAVSRSSAPRERRTPLKRDGFLAAVADAPAVPDRSSSTDLRPAASASSSARTAWARVAHPGYHAGCALAGPECFHLTAGAALRVRYLCYEDEPRVRWRLDRVCEAAGIDATAWRDAEAAGTLRIAADLAPLFVQGAHDAPRPTDMFRSLAKSLERDPADLCIIDPLAAATVLQSENDNSALNAVAVSLRDLARNTGCAVLLTHHTSKANRDAADHHASRGGSALTGAARWVLRLIQNGGDRSRLVAGIPKNSYGRGLGEITLERLDKGVLRELNGTYLGKQKEALVEGVVRFVNENPEIEINPKAVRRNCSPGAKALITYLDTSPKAASEAVERALDEERVQLEERRRPDNRKKYQVLAPWVEDDLEQVPF